MSATAGRQRPAYPVDDVGAPTGSNRGLRSRLIVGFVAVSAVTALITAAVAVVGALFIFVTRPRGSLDVGRGLIGSGPFTQMSDKDLVLLVVLAALILLVIAVGAGWAVAQRMLRPVRTLAEAAERVAGGDLDVRLRPDGRDELAQLVVTFNAMTANLSDSMSELRRMEQQSRRFASDVSHELRSPLAAMTAVTDVLSDETDEMSPQAGKAARLVVQEISHLDRLVNDLIEMSRFDAGTALLDTDVIDVQAAVEACLALRGWTGLVQTSVPAGLQIVVDRRRFDVILANLVGNAIRYGAPPIEVAVQVGSQVGPQVGSVGPAAGQLILTVADHGPGLPVTALPHIFERFYKAESARTRSAGSGLGLAIALENARLHGGTVLAENRPGGGAVFSLVLATGTVF